MKMFIQDVCKSVSCSYSLFSDSSALYCIVLYCSCCEGSPSNSELQLSHSCPTLVQQVDSFEPCNNTTKTTNNMPPSGGGRPESASYLDHLARSMGPQCQLRPISM